VLAERRMLAELERARLAPLREGKAFADEG
jgi:hypothetical protein